MISHRLFHYVPELSLDVVESLCFFSDVKILVPFHLVIIDYYRLSMNLLNMHDSLGILKQKKN